MKLVIMNYYYYYYYHTTRVKICQFNKNLLSTLSILFIYYIYIINNTTIFCFQNKNKTQIWKLKLKTLQLRQLFNPDVHSIILYYSKFSDINIVQ